MTANPDGSIGFAAAVLNTWEKFELIGRDRVDRRLWAPAQASGGTELMLQSLRARLGDGLDRIALQRNRAAEIDNPQSKPTVSWIHQDIDCAHESLLDARRVDATARFVFVSDWQMQRHLRELAFPPKKCLVIRNAVEPGPPGNQWTSARPWRIRCAFISAPYRGLSNLIRAWKKLSPTDLELHVWSGTRLWGRQRGDEVYRHLFAEVADAPNAFYHGIAPNGRIRAALRDMHFLTMPSDFLETFCISAAEAMAAGCRVIAPAIGALPETTAGFAKLYDPGRNREEHIDRFLDALTNELENPWNGSLDLRESQFEYVSRELSWDRREDEWRRLIDALTG